jgi:hypothetical protein
MFFWHKMSPVQEGTTNLINVAKALNITYINYPDGVIENQTVTGL